jgi:hypothetical protein
VYYDAEKTKTRSQHAAATASHDSVKSVRESLCNSLAPRGFNPRTFGL